MQLVKVRIENFGPINKASIETKPLTLIIGKNNQGKSYSVVLIFTLLQLRQFLTSAIGVSVGPRKNSLGISVQPRYRGRLPGRGGHVREHRLITIKREDFDKDKDYSLAAQIVDNTVSTLLFFVENNLQSLLEERFGMNVGALVNICAPVANLNFDLSKYLSIAISISRKGKVGVKFYRKEKELDKLKLKVVPFIKKMRSDLDMVLEMEGPFPRHTFDLFHFLFNELNGRAKEGIGDLVYIPAGRAGLLEGYYGVASALFALSSVAITRGISMPPMPPSAAIYYNTMLRFTGTAGVFKGISSELGSEVLDGQVALKHGERQRVMPRIIYTFSKGKSRGRVDVIHAGSMVKELAGLYLTIREKIKPGTYLMVEEPESHLHPSAQKKLARILMKLAASGVNLLITTHSDIILRKIAHLVGQLQKTDSKDILPASRVSVILLKEGGRGSISEKLAIPPSGVLEGIPTFDEVITELYEEEINLESQPSKEE